MSKIYAFIEFLITVVLRCTANTRAVLNRFRLWRWLNTPMSESCAPVVRWWNAKAELANSDRNRYFMSARRRYGIFGYGLYTQYQPIVLTDEYNTEIEELMKFRYKHESSFFMGGRFEVMAYIKGLRNSDFDNAITMDEFRAARFTAYIDAFCADTMNHQSLFRHWLSVQVRTGMLVEIDGYVFTGATKNCEIGAFLYKYFDTFETAHAVGLHQGYRSPEHLAQYLVKELQKAALGLTDSFEFECINAKLRDYTERNKASQIAVTDLGNDATPIEMVDAMIQAHIADRAKNILSEDDFIGVKPDRPWPRKPSNIGDAEITTHVPKMAGVQFTKPSPDIRNMPGSYDRITHGEELFNITFTDASVVNLGRPFDFTDVLTITVNGTYVEFGLCSVEAGLSSAGITFSEDKQILYYTPVHNEVTSVVLQLKKTSDVKRKAMADFTVVAKPRPSGNTKPSFTMDFSPEIAPESLVDIQSLARSVSAASGRLDADKLSRS